MEVIGLYDFMFLFELLSNFLKNYLLVKKDKAAPMLLLNPFDYFSQVGKRSGYHRKIVILERSLKW